MSYILVFCTIYRGHAVREERCEYIYCGPKNGHPFSFNYSFYKCWPISIIFGTRYIELICNTTIIDLSTSPT